MVAAGVQGTIFRQANYNLGVVPHLNNGLLITGFGFLTLHTHTCIHVQVCIYLEIELLEKSFGTQRGFLVCISENCFSEDFVQLFLSFSLSLSLSTMTLYT